MQEEFENNPEDKKAQSNLINTTQNKDHVATAEKAFFPPFDDFVDGLCSWKDPLQHTWKTANFQKLYSFLKTEYKYKTIYPSPDLIFNAYKLTPFTKVKVVILGQDPYFQAGQAMGLAFSVPHGVKVPSSLKNIFKLLQSDPNIENFKMPTHGDLTQWAQQGVLLTNTLLTVEENKAGGHKKSGWNEFIDQVLHTINKECDGVIFLLWGLEAQKKASFIDETRHHVLKTSHPSGQSVFKGFLTSNHFSLVNQILEKSGRQKIDWRLDD